MVLRVLAARVGLKLFVIPMTVAAAVHIEVHVKIQRAHSNNHLRLLCDERCCIVFFSTKHDAVCGLDAACPAILSVPRLHGYAVEVGMATTIH